MRALLAVLVVLGLASFARADFDHNAHERDVYTKGGDPILCAKCHPMNAGVLVGRPDHAACFGACHGPSPRLKGTIPEEQQRLCASCHPQLDATRPVVKRPAVAFPPYAPGDFALAADHKAHAAFACTQCHAVPPEQRRAPTRSAPHRRCIGCHDGAKAFPMTTCAPCHTPGSGTPLPARMAEPLNTVTSAFSHPKHAQRGATCASCHLGVAATSDNILPRPAATSCALGGCHDAKKAFPITEACTRCHTRAPPRFDITRADTRFSHATHASALPAAPCTTCHTPTAGNEVITVGHAPCAACHAEDFTQREPKYCSACHNSTEPWRKLIADRPPAESTEFGATLSHATPAHAAIACTTCHSLRTADSQLRPVRGHKTCTGKGCHATTGGAAPTLATCDGCHREKLVARRIASRAAAAWSVRELFQHATHTKAPCSSCHTDLSAPSVEKLATPAKATCQGCHNGATAFKLTGTGCARCHPRGSSKTN